MEPPAGNPLLARMSRRIAERYPLPPSILSATWLVEGRPVHEQGVLGDISSGGFSAWMTHPPPHGRLLHAKLQLDDPKGETLCVFGADLKVCGRRYTSKNPQEPYGWVVNLAMESIHPADEKMMMNYIDIIKTRH